jgi:Recombinase
MAKRRQQRRRAKVLRHTPKPGRSPDVVDAEIGASVERLTYTRKEAAEALGISLATLDRRVVPAIATVKTEWGARLILARELHRFLAERTEQPRAPYRRSSRSGRRSKLSADLVARIRREHSAGSTLAEIARGLNRDDIPTGQGGRQWWPSTVRSVMSSGGH